MEKGNEHDSSEKVPANFGSRNARPLPTRIKARINASQDGRQFHGDSPIS